MSLSSRFCFLIVASFLFLSVPGVASSEDEGATTGRDRLPSSTGECVFVRSLQDWRAIDRYSLVIYAPSRNHPYKVELTRSCPDLRFAETIAFTAPDGRLCDYRREAVIVGHHRCPIGRIEAISVEEAKALTSRKKDKKPDEDVSQTE